MNDSVEEKKRRRRERKKQRYAEEPEFREKVKASGSAYQLKNKDAINARRRHKYATDPEYRAKRIVREPKAERKKQLKRKYGLSLEGYGAMLSRQNGVCAICLKEAVSKPLCVDHDHKRRMLRDLLCDACNKGLGHYRDDSALMRRGADYLDFWQQCHEEALKAGLRSATAGTADPHGVPVNHFPIPKGGVMTRTDDTIEDNKAGRMMRRAILHELLQPFDLDPPPPVDMLQAVSRALVHKAAQGNLTAVKETLDRIDG